MEFMVDKIALGQVFLHVLQFFPAIIIPVMLATHCFHLPQTLNNVSSWQCHQIKCSSVKSEAAQAEWGKNSGNQFQTSELHKAGIREISQYLLFNFLFRILTSTNWRKQQSMMAATHQIVL